MVAVFWKAETVGINIKHDEYEAAIRELAFHDGVSLTDAIGQAVLEKLERQRTAAARESYVERARRLQAYVANLPILDDRTPDEIIGYDEHGLPN